MKTFKQSITENASGDELIDLKLQMIEWWKKHSKQPNLAPKKKELDKKFNRIFNDIEDVIELIYDSEPED